MNRKESRSRSGLRQVVGVVATVASLAAAAACSGSSAAAKKPPASVAAVASHGCQTATQPRPHSTLNFAGGGASGTYIQDVPAGAASKRPMPVVFDLHGYLEAANFERIGTRISAYGDQHGFVTITPQLSEAGNPRWDYSENSPDFAWIAALLTHVENSLCVDQRRVYATGLSMGAFMSSAIPCQLSDRFAAVAPVAGLQAYPWCHPKRAVPVVAFHGTNDPYIAYTGGPGPQGLKLPSPDGSGKSIGQELKAHPNAPGNLMSESIPAALAGWAKRNGCGATATSKTIASDVTLISYPCAATNSVELYRITGGGHTWPGGPSGVYPGFLVGRTTHSISANEIIWKFFQAHPLAGPIGS